MKVEEAKEKVCPFMPFISQKLDAEGIEIQNFNSKCICGDCMAWVVTKTHSDTQMEDYIEVTPPDHNGNTHHKSTRPKELSDDKKEGHCSRLQS